MSEPERKPSQESANRWEDISRRIEEYWRDFVPDGTQVPLRESGLFYAPYIPLQVYKAFASANSTFIPTIRFKARYGLLTKNPYKQDKNDTD